MLSPGKILIISSLCILLLFGVGFVVVQYFEHDQSVDDSVFPSSETSRDKQETSFTLDTNDWKTHRNEWFGFQIQYPPHYTLKGPGIKNLLRTFYGLKANFYHEDQTTSYGYIRVIYNREDKKIDEFDSTLSEHMDYLMDPNVYVRMEHITFEDRVIPVYFHEYDLGNWADGRAAVIAVVEQDDVVFFLHKPNATTLDPEFITILSTLCFDECLRGTGNEHKAL